MAVETAPAGTCATEDAVDVGVERDATTTTMDAKSANDRGDEGGGTDEEDEEETEEREEEYLGRIRRRARGAEVGEESEEDDEEAGDEDDVGGGRGARRRRLKRANGERVVRARGVESDVDSSDSSDLEEEDEELVMERKYAETGRLTDEDVEEEDAEGKRENALESGAFDDEEAYSSDSSEGIPVVDDVEAPASGGGRKKTKKQLKKEREALLKDQERMMKKAQKRARFPGWNVVPERMSYLPLIEKLRAALANLPPPPKMQPNVCRQAPKAPTPETNAAVDARDDDAETRAEKDPIEIDMDSDEDDDVMLREILAKKMAPNPMSAVTNEPEKPADGATAAAGDDANDEREEEEEDDSESELSEEEEDITEEEQRLQRKAAKKYFKADRKTKAKAGGELFEDEAEMSEDGGHTDDDDDDIRDDVDDIADVAVAALTEAGHTHEVYEVTGPRLLTFTEAAREISAAAGREVRFMQIPKQDFNQAIADSGAPDDLIWLMNYLFETVLDGRNAHLADGVQRALGREPRDFTLFAQQIASEGRWTAADENVA